MESPHNPSGPEQTADIDSVGVLIARLIWILVGPVVLMFMAYAIVTAGSGWTTAWDVAYVVVVGLMIGGRWIEQRSGAATTATGDRATMHHFRRYVVVLAAVAAVIWIAANVFGNHVLA